MSRELTLPRGWCRTALGAVLEIVRGVSYDKSESAKEPGEGRIPILRATNIGKRLDFDDLVYVPQKCVSHEQMLRCGDIVIAASSGSLSVVGKAARLNEEWQGSFGAFCMGLRVKPGIDSAYVAYFLGTSEYRHGVSQLAAGSNINNLRRTHIESFLFPLAPLPEQRRIVAKIEELFSDLDAGVAALERVRANLKRYRASVLKAAVEGHLTEEWRRQLPASEPAAKLLERILAERRAKWEQDQLRKFKEAGKTPPKGWKEKYEEPETPADGELPALPRGWRWCSVDQLISYLRNGWGLKPSPEPPGHRILRISAVRPRSVDLAEVRFVSESKDEVAGYFIEDGDLLFTRYNGSVDLLGVCGLVRGCSTPTLHPDKLIRVRTVIAEPLNAFVEIAAHVGESRRHMKSRARTTAGQTGISGPDIRQMPIPLPPLAEQAEIVAEVDRRLSVADAAEQQVEHALQRAARLRQSILKRAFEGRLVDQDPSDEPAAVMLGQFDSTAGSGAPRARRTLRAKAGPNR